jgi:peptide/nickel transport system permease protein
MRQLRGWLGVLPLAAIFGIVAAAPWLVPYDPAAMDPAASMLPPGVAHWMGTDVFGRDLLSRVLMAGRPALGIALATTAICALLGIPLGIVAALRGGWTDFLLMRVLEIGFAIPPLVLGVAILGTLGPGLGNVVLALAVCFTPLLARIARGAALARQNELFVLAGRAAGATEAGIMFRIVLPNIAGTLVTQTALVFSYALLAEASLSFLGLGTQPDDPSWGRLLTDTIPMTAIAPWLGVFPGLAIVVVVMLLNLQADAFGDAVDPRTRR